MANVAISPDGKLLATAGEDDNVKIWQLQLNSEATTAELLHTLRGLGTGPLSVDFSPDGMKLAIGGEDGTAKIWDAEKGQEVFSVQAHSSGISELTFSPNGNLLATAGYWPDAIAKIWNVSSGKEISSFLGHDDPRYSIKGIGFSPDGERVAMDLGDGSVKIWDAKTGDELLDLVGHIAPVIGVDFSPDGRYLATGSPDGTVRKWDASSGEELVVYRSASGPLFDVKITPDGKKMIVSGTGYIYGYSFDLDETIRLARSRLTRWFTLEECRKYLHQEECPMP